MKKILILAIALIASAFGQRKVVGPINLDGAINGGTSAVGTDSYAITTSSEASLQIKQYATNQCFTFKADVANTGAASLAVDGLAAKTIKKAEGGVTTDLADNEIRAGQVVTTCYDGTNLQMQSRSGVAASGESTSVTNSGASGAAVLKNSTNVTARKLVAGTNVTVTENTDDITIAATGGGSSAITSNAGDAAFMPWGLCRFSADLNNIIANGDTQLYALENDISKQYREFGFIVAAAAASGKGMVASIYTRASNGDLTRIAISAGILVDTIGKKYVAWSSGTAVSGGVLTLPAGQNLYLGLTLDATAGTAPSIRFYDEAGAEVLGLITKDFTSTLKRTAAAANSSSGTGASVTSPATIANASYAVVNEYRPLIAFLP